MFLIDSNVRGAGKSLLADVVGMIAEGRSLSRMAYSTDDDEMRKRITSLAIGGDQIVLLDNIAGVLGTAALDMALTGTTWKDRILGRSEIASVPLNMVWLATGNNVILGADIARRLIHIRLESACESPEDRDDFVHPDLLGWVKAERTAFVRDALLILRAHFIAGRPSCGVSPIGSFDRWCSLVRNAVIWLGLLIRFDASRTRGSERRRKRRALSDSRELE